MAATDERGIALTGEGGFLPEMIKALLERGMQTELTQHLGYDKHDPAGRGSGNSRNGTTGKTVSTEVGDVTLEQPRDRNSSFASALLPIGTGGGQVPWSGVSRNAFVWASSQVLNACFERPSSTASRRDGPVLVLVGVRSMMTVTYLSPCRTFFLENDGCQTAIREDF